MRSFLLLAVLLAAAAPAAAQGDPERGLKLHRDHCLYCHGFELYVFPKAKVRSLKALREATRRWGDYYVPVFDKQEIEDLYAYLNRDFYQLKK